MEIDILIAVEDPGAANFVLDLPLELEKIKLNTAIISFGAAHKFLNNINVKNINCSNIEDVNDIFDRFSFKILIAGTSQNPNSVILELISKCQKISIITIGVVDMAADSDLRFKGNSNSSLFHAPDFLIVPDEFSLNNFVNLGFDINNIFEVIHPSFIRLRNKAKLFSKDKINKKRNLFLKNRKPDTEIWLFACEYNNDPRLTKDEKYTIKGRGFSNKRINIILEEVLDIRKERENKPFLILRLHPKNKLSDFEEYLEEIDFISNVSNPLEDILCSDLVIGSTTIFLMEAIYLGKPTLSIIPKKGEEIWSPSLLHKLSPCAYTNLEIRNELKKYKKRKDKQININEKDKISNIIKKILKTY